jgi:hypothetical protein
MMSPSAKYPAVKEAAAPYCPSAAHSAPQVRQLPTPIMIESIMLIQQGAQSMIRPFSCLTTIHIFVQADMHDFAPEMLDAVLAKVENDHLMRCA